MKRSQLYVGALIFVVVLVVAGVYIYIRASKQDDSMATSGTLQTDVGALPQANKSGIDTTHVASDVVPPTNKWFSGVALQKTPQPIFAMPLSLKPTDSGLEIGIPRVTTGEKTIAAPHIKALQLSPAGATSYKITRYDPLSVDITFYKGDSALAVATITQGSPYVFLNALQAVDVELEGQTSLSSQGDYTRASTPNGAMGIRTTAQDVAANTRLSKGEFISVFPALTDDQASYFSRYALNVVKSTEVSYARDHDMLRTTFDIKTTNNEPTVFGYMPHQTQPNPRPSGTQLDTLYGLEKFASGTSFTFETPKINIQPDLPVAKLSDTDKTTLRAALKKDAQSLKAAPADSYYGGKSVYRKAQLLDIAHALGEKGIEKTLQDSLATDLTTWLAPQSSVVERSFYYDTKAKGVVGNLPSFGSEQFNDHHFHYGYFIYASAILGKYDPDFVTQYKPAVDTLISDIASPEQSKNFPQMRVFDPFMGHSWASGYAPFADGNNQESSSEALNAWIGTSLWARATDNQALATYSAWLLSNEAASTKQYWTDFDTSENVYKGFSHEVMSLNWGGKRDYATFFSDDPGAKLAIQLLPLSPTAAGTLPSENRIRKQLDEASSATLFNDYLTMYEALIDPDSALAKAEDLPDDKIDDGNSRTYMLAWIMTRK